MPLPPSGTITIDDLRTEFGATGARGLGDFYRGGAFVPNTPTNASVPTSGTIQLSDFYGASAGPSAVGTLISTGIGAITGMALSGSNIQIISGFAAAPPFRGRFSTNGGLTWNAQSNLPNRGYSLAHVTGSTTYASNLTVSGGVQNFSLRATAAFTGSPGWSIIGGLPSSGSITGCYSVASNGSTVVTAPSTNVYYASSNPTAATPTWTRTVTGAPCGAWDCMRYFSNVNLFVSWSTFSAPLWSYSTTGLGAWTSGPLSFGVPGITGIYDIGIRSSGGTVQAVAVGRNNLGNLVIITNTSTTGIGALSGTSWTSATTPSGLTGSFMYKVIWVPSANRWVCADSAGNFASSANGTSWTVFNTVANGSALSVVDTGTHTVWGLDSGSVMRLAAADIP